MEKDNGDGLSDELNPICIIKNSDQNKISPIINALDGLIKKGFLVGSEDNGSYKIADYIKRIGVINVPAFKYPTL